MGKSIAEVLGRLQVNIDESESRITSGTVESVSPLLIKKEKLLITEDYIVRSSPIDYLGLKVGQEVILLQANRQQTYYILDIPEESFSDKVLKDIAEGANPDKIITNFPEKTVPNDDDFLVIKDTEPKKIKYQNLIGKVTGDLLDKINLHNDRIEEIEEGANPDKIITSFPEKTVPNDDDFLVIKDTEPKKINYQNLVDKIRADLLTTPNPVDFKSGALKVYGDRVESGVPVEFTDVDFCMPNGRRVAYFPASDLNDVVEEWILGSNGSNYPGGGFWYVNTIMYSDPEQRKQIAYGYTNDRMYTRRLYGGSWSEWGGVYEVVERGSNGNGTYIKYADGRMTVSVSKSVTMSISQAQGALFFNALVWTFPAAFSSDDIKTTVHRAKWGAGASFGANYEATGSKASFAIYDTASRTSDTVDFRATAEGWWK